MSSLASGVETTSGRFIFTAAPNKHFYKLSFLPINKSDHLKNTTTSVPPHPTPPPSIQSQLVLI